MIKLDIISGFLGAGKTTMIRKLMAAVSSWKEKMVLIENEFGKIGIDGDLVKREGIEVYEISQGCICCTLKDDFMYTLLEIADKLKPDRIIFEPSGIFVLTDALEILSVPDVAARFKVNSLTTIIDSVNYIKQSSRFGYFFENQIANVSTLVLSKTQLVSEEDVDRIIADLKRKNSKANILAKRWDELAEADMKAILGETLEYSVDIPHGYTALCRHHSHGQEDSARPDGCQPSEVISGGHASEAHPAPLHTEGDHGHSSEAGHGFETFGMKTSKVFLPARLEDLLAKVREGKFGDILRGKGFLRSPAGYIEFSYTDGDFSIREYKGVQEGKVSFIGEKLDSAQLMKQFESL